MILMKGKEIELNCIIEKEGEIFSALCLELDVASCGNTPQEAAENLKDAIVSYLDYAVASGKFEEYVPRPVPGNVLRQYKERAQNASEHRERLRRELLDYNKIPHKIVFKPRYAC